MSLEPWILPSAFQVDWPCLTSTKRVGRGGRGRLGSASLDDDDDDAFAEVVVLCRGVRSGSADFDALVSSDAGTQHRRGGTVVGRI